LIPVLEGLATLRAFERHFCFLRHRIDTIFAEIASIRSLLVVLVDTKKTKSFGSLDLVLCPEKL
jgi:hypothetical protein